jgi:excisionase family DNA binding protein
MTKMLSVKEVAERLGVTPRAIHRWIKRGYFPGAYKLSPALNSPYRIPESDIIAFEERRERQTVGN